jgi:cytoplasmic iron level regulating protein YaaA (DUF328/UPF0246 family)
VLILLPPSEGKAASGSGVPLDLAILSLPELRRARERVVKALVRVCSAARPDRALAALGLTEGQRGAVERNGQLLTAATLPAGELYTGVLYDALSLATLSRDAYALAERSLLISSGLWGAVRIGDRIPAYRCSIGATLPALGGLGAYWRTVLPPVMARTAGEDLVLDLRSSAYAAAWTPAGEQAERTVAVRVLHERPQADGTVKRTVVSHFNKAAKGRLVRDLLAGGVQPESPAELVVALRDLKHTVEERFVAAGGPRRLDLVVSEL